MVTDQRIEALVSSDDDDINDQLVYLPSAPDIDDPEIEFTSLTTKNSMLKEADQIYEIKLQTPPVHDAHPYYGGTKQGRSVGNPGLPNQDMKRDGRHRRKGHHHEYDQQNVLLPKSIDAAVATVTNNPKRLTPTNGGTTIVTQTAESKAQRARSARLEGKKTTTGYHRLSTDNDIDFVPH